MPEHVAECNCGRLRAIATGDPIRVSVCHCLACQRRTGSAFGVQARFARANVRIVGEWREYTRISDDGEPRVFSFCPECGATVYYGLPDDPDLVAVPVGAFADPSFPPPVRSVYGFRRHPWVSVTGTVEHVE